ncbi:hypothetical protein EMQ25_08765 [Arsenicitalea aurantiaca]|uniref:Uncharacterized protein n=1 Tax=Arsenicitalea aurantiaca TaxID=1783274 RepID=A0A433XA82_9HYPH|nr:hypothetical protein [Arsenicitalea aurantiaca]RUT30962.1 hypothetical protein EMQ25_08765 [Arsenicitalea aurantiaca]
MIGTLQRIAMALLMLVGMGVHGFGPLVAGPLPHADADASLAAVSAPANPLALRSATALVPLQPAHLRTAPPEDRDGAAPGPAGIASGLDLPAALAFEPDCAGAPRLHAASFVHFDACAPPVKVS